MSFFWGGLVLSPVGRGPQFLGVPSDLSPATVGRLPVTAGLREVEVVRLGSSPYGLMDLAFVRALGTQFRYLNWNQAHDFFPGVSEATFNKRLGLLWRHQWIDRTMLPGGASATIYRLGALGKDWLTFSGTPSRWALRTGEWSGRVDPLLEHWLGTAEVWSGLNRMTAWAAFSGSLRITRFDTELDYAFGRFDARTKWKPDGLFELTWGSTLAETFVAYFEMDRDTEPLSRWVTNKIANARAFSQSGRWPWRGVPVDYWVFVPSSERLAAIEKLLHQPPFGTVGTWVIIPWQSWLSKGFDGQRDWVIKRDGRSAGGRWDTLRSWMINARRQRPFQNALQKS